MSKLETFEGLLVRADTTDSVIVRESLIDKVYDTDCHQRAAQWGHGEAMKRKYASILADGKRPFILNLGGHVGSSAVWFQRRWPKAFQVVCEPDRESFGLLNNNIDKAFGITMPIETHCCAIGTRNGKGRILSYDGHPAGYRIEYDDSGPVDIITPNLFMPDKKSDLVPFICKVDVEGSENELFYSDWAAPFACVMLEPHDYLFPGRHILKSFMTMLSRGHWDLLIRGDVLQAFNCSELDMGVP